MSSSPSPSPSLLSSWRLLPPKPGVYIFKDQQQVIIYVGKAKNLHTRVGSYLKPPTQLGSKTLAMVTKAVTLETIEVASELEALLLESRLIKKFQPFYNLISKDDKSPYYIHITKEAFPKPVTNHDSKQAAAGPFLNRYVTTQILRQFRRVAPYCVAPRPVKRPCLYSHMGLCHPCPGQITSPDEKRAYLANITRLKKLLSGQFSAVKTALTHQMLIESDVQNFEQAAILRNYLRSLEQLLTTPVSPDDYIENPNLTQDLRQAAVDTLSRLLKLPKLNRIEMYDNAHLSGTSATAAMTVAMDGALSPRFYRHFTIKNARPDSDVDMMKEVLSRRFQNPDWPNPDLIVLDGGKPQLSAVLNITPPPPLKLRGGVGEGDIEIMLIALAKREESILIPMGNSFQEIRLPKSHPGLQLLQQLRDEAHRFSRRLHHLHRSKDLFK
jgi:excinuclease ABC subunit C